MLEDLEARINEAKGRLVRSPDRLRKTISEMSYQVAAQKEELGRTTEKLHEHTKRLEVLQGLETELKRLIILGKEIAAQQETTEQLRRNKEKLQAAVDQARTEGERLMERNNHLERQISFADEKLIRQRERIKEFHKNSQARIAELTAEYNQKDKERAVMEGQLVELENEQKQLHAEMKEYIAKNQAEIRKVLEAYWNLRQRAGKCIIASRDHGLTAQTTTWSKCPVLSASLSKSKFRPVLLLCSLYRCTPLECHCIITTTSILWLRRSIYFPLNDLKNSL